MMLEEEIGDFPMLTQLDISYNKLLQTVPYSLGDLEKLSSLSLQGCALTVRFSFLACAQLFSFVSDFTYLSHENPCKCRLYLTG